MTVNELISHLVNLPPMAEVYVQTFNTALNKVESVKKDDTLGIVELKWEKK